MSLSFARHYNCVPTLVNQSARIDKEFQCLLQQNRLEDFNQCWSCRISKCIPKWQSRSKTSIIKHSPKLRKVQILPCHGTEHDCISCQYLTQFSIFLSVYYVGMCARNNDAHVQHEIFQAASTDNKNWMIRFVDKLIGSLVYVKLLKWF